MLKLVVLEGWDWRKIPILGLGVSFMATLSEIRKFLPAGYIFTFYSNIFKNNCLQNLHFTFNACKV